MESLRQQGKPEYFQDLRNRLLQQLEENWEDSDTEVLELIDELMAGYCKTVYMSISQRQSLRKELFQSVRKMDILEELLEDDSITEIMVNGWNRVFIERGGRIFPWNKSFSSPEKLEDVIQQMAARCNRVINTMQPIVDARLKNGERVNAVIAPVALDGPVLTIRRFPKDPITMEKLIEMDRLILRNLRRLPLGTC